MKVIAFYDKKMEKFKEFTSKLNSISGVEVLRLESDKNAELVKRYAITKFPTIIIEDKGIVKRKFEEDISVTEISKYFTQK